MLWWEDRGHIYLVIDSHTHELTQSEVERLYGWCAAKGQFWPQKNRFGLKYCPFRFEIDGHVLEFSDYSSLLDMFREGMKVSHQQIPETTVIIDGSTIRIVVSNTMWEARAVYVGQRHLEASLYIRRHGDGTISLTGRLDAYTYAGIPVMIDGELFVRINGVYLGIDMVTDVISDCTGLERIFVDTALRLDYGEEYDCLKAKI